MHRHMAIVKNTDDSYTKSNSNLDEWTIIEDNSYDQNVLNVADSNKCLEDHDHIEILGGKDISSSNMCNVMTSHSEEEKDITSATTDSDSDQVIVNRNKVKNVDTLIRKAQKIFFSDHVTPMLSQGSLLIQRKGIIRLIIICLLIIVVGFLAGCTVRTENQCIMPNDMDLQTKLENDLLMKQVQELNEVKQLLNQINLNILKSNEVEHGFIQIEENMKNWKTYQKSDDQAFKANMIVPESLQLLHVLCAVTNKILNTNQTIMNDICNMPKIIFGVNELKNVVTNSINELHQLNNPSQIRYLEDMENRLSYISQSLLDDVYSTVDSLIIKMYNKINKVKNKVNKWACSMQEKGIFEDQVLKTFIRNISFLKNCNQTQKPSIIEDVNKTTFHVLEANEYFQNRFDHLSNTSFNFWDKLNATSCKLDEHFMDMISSTYSVEQKWGNKKNYLPIVNQKDDPISAKIKKVKETLNSEQNNEKIVQDPLKKKIVGTSKNFVRTSFKGGKNKKQNKNKKAQKDKIKKRSASINDSPVKFNLKMEHNEYSPKSSQKQNRLKGEKLKKYNKKGKKCLSKKCQKSLKYNGKHKFVNSVKNLDIGYAKKQKIQNTSIKSKFYTVAKYSKNMILTTEYNPERKRIHDDMNDLSNTDWQSKRYHAREEIRRLHNQPTNN